MQKPGASDQSPHTQRPDRGLSNLLGILVKELFDQGFGFRVCSSRRKSDQSCAINAAKSHRVVIFNPVTLRTAFHSQDVVRLKAAFSTCSRRGKCSNCPAAAIRNGT